MILILGRAGDRCGQLTYELLQKRGAEVVMIEVAKLFSGTELGFSLERQYVDSFLVLDGRKIPYSEISAVLVRGQPWFEQAPDLSAEDQTYFPREMSAAFFAIQQAFCCPVFNRQSPGMPYGPFTSEVSAGHVVRCGFRLPDSMVTADQEMAQDFYQRHRQHLLLDWSMGTGMFQLIEGNAGSETLRQQISKSAVSLLSRPPGLGVQVVVVGDRVLAADSQGKQAELPSETRERCRQLARTLGFPFVQLTVICGDDGQDYCLDIDPQPDCEQWEDQLLETVAAGLADGLQQTVVEAAIR